MAEIVFFLFFNLFCSDKKVKYEEAQGPDEQDSPVKTLSLTPADLSREGAAF